MERKILIQIRSLQKITRKALLYRLITNIESLVSDAGLSHQEVSTRTGRKGNWFNDAFNNSEDIKISSLAKLLSAVNDSNEINQYNLTAIFDETVLKISSVIASLSDEEMNNIIEEFILSETELFLDLLGDWGSLEAKKKLSQDEQLCYLEVKKLLKQSSVGKEEENNA